ncbi:MAG: endonuclease/exonuclease/phosphatase family protein, partial [Pseudomonadota bacterium]
FVELLQSDLDQSAGINFPTAIAAPSNTGIPSGFDLNGDGQKMGAADALGYGRFPGQYALAVLSVFESGSQRAFKDLKWSAVPWAVKPMNPDGTPYFPDDVWAALPLSSKTHLDVAIHLPDGRILHLLSSHPTPPVFDGPENRNGLRNAAEVRFWIDYIDGADWILDDDGTSGGLPPEASFVILGDLNADPLKGDGDRTTVARLLAHPRVRDPRPASPGAAELGRPHDTADWPEMNGPGNLRVDYVLPSSNLTLAGSGVFWPTTDDPIHRLVEIKGRDLASSDHRLVWVDIKLEPQ